MHNFSGLPGANQKYHEIDCGYETKAEGKGYRDVGLGEIQEQVGATPGEFTDEDLMERSASEPEPDDDRADREAVEPEVAATWPAWRRVLVSRDWFCLVV